MKTSSTFLSKVLRSSDIYRPISMRFHDITYVDNPELSFYLLNKIKNKESNIKYLTHSLLKKIALFSIYYLSNLKNDNSKIKKIIISYRDPIERIKSLLYMEHTLGTKRDNTDLIKYQLFYKLWLKQNIIDGLNISLSDERIDYVESKNVEDYVLKTFNIVCNEKINSSSDKQEYQDVTRDIKFTKSFINQLYLNFLSLKFTSKEELKNIMEIYSSDTGYDNLDFLIRD